MINELKKVIKKYTNVIQMNLGALLSMGLALLGIWQGKRACGGPLQINLATTGRCNIRCVHCYYFSPLATGAHTRGNRLAQKTGIPAQDFQPLGKDVDGQLMRRLISEAMSLGTKHILLSGVGEPLLNPAILDIISDIKKRNGYCLINTNGTLLTPEISEEFIKRNVDELRITIMSGTPDGYQKTHPGASPQLFHNLKKNIAYLVEKRNENNKSKPEIIITSVITSYNCDGIAALADFVIETGADKITFRAFDHCDDEQMKQLIVSVEQAIRARDEMLAYRPIFEKKHIKHNIDSFLSVFNGQIDTTKLYSFIPCYYGWLNANIDIDGSVYMCCKCYTPLGNIHESSFKEIWYGESFRRFRKSAKHINSKGQSLSCECSRCANSEPNIRIFKLLHPLKWKKVKEIINPVEN